MSNFNRNEVIAYGLGYRVNNKGQLIGLKGKPIGSVSNGYYRFKIRQNSGFINCLTHRLQAYQKYGMDIYKTGIVCRHLNGNSLFCKMRLRRQKWPIGRPFLSCAACYGNSALYH